LRHAQVRKQPSEAHRHGLFIALVAIGCALVIAACGSSSNATNSVLQAPFLAFSKCMRSHGVPSFPDPTSGGGIHISSGINPFSPSFKAAQASCRKLLPGGGPGAGHPSAQAKAQTLTISECMRQHGISGFPDPTLSLPSSPAGYSAIIDRGGVILAIPKTIDPRSPTFEQAAAACGFGH
jgi:hypothetical protein